MIDSSGKRFATGLSRISVSLGKELNVSDFIVNIIHRPELAPEYAEKVTGSGKKENIAREDLRDESLEIFRFQQNTAHKNGLKTTIQMTYASLFSDEAVALAKKDHEEWGDEIALSLLGLPCEQFRQKYHTREFCIWMFSMEDKKAIVDDVFSLFHEKFGFWPQSTGSYYLDADLINYIKKSYPSVKCAIATCWEEGPKAYHTCNNSWYTFMDGGPWAPWIPSRSNTHAPASGVEDDSGIVAIPHLSRDLLACYDGNGSNFGTHPQNVLRGMIYDTKTWEYPYYYNLVDQYRSLAAYNDGYAYNMMFVGPGWLNRMGRWEAPYELLKKSYEDGMAYYGTLKKAGKLQDMTMSQFADYFRGKKSYREPECALWRDILYGSDKQLFWYLDSDMRACINMDQGGALVDLRNYAAKQHIPVGVGTGNTVDASYPFLIQEKYRAGYFTHYAGAGTVRSAVFSCEGQEANLCQCRTHARLEETGTDEEDLLCSGNGTKKAKERRLILDPVEIVLGDLSFHVRTTVLFRQHDASIAMTRKVYGFSRPGAKVSLKEYITACYGTTEYTQDMTGVTLGIDSFCPDGKDVDGDGFPAQEILEYRYKDRRKSMENAARIWARIPQIQTFLSMECSRPDAVGEIEEGYAFSPMFTLNYTMELEDGEEVTTWLRLAKAD